MWEIGPQPVFYFSMVYAADFRFDNEEHWALACPIFWQIRFSDGSTRLGKTRHFGPLRVQRPFFRKVMTVCISICCIRPVGLLEAIASLLISLWSLRPMS